MTGAWLLANKSNQTSDCTGGRKGDAVRYCQSEQLIIWQFQIPIIDFGGHLRDTIL